jgi:hypothetical protein
MEFTSFYTFNNSVLEFQGQRIVFHYVPVIEDADEFFYPLTCAIYRSVGETDSDGYELFDGLWYGHCSLEAAASGGNSLKDFVIKGDYKAHIPSTEVSMRVNDRVVVFHHNNRVITSTILDFIVEKEGYVSGSTLWLKDADES